MNAATKHPGIVAQREANKAAKKKAQKTSQDEKKFGIFVVSNNREKFVAASL